MHLLKILCIHILFAAGNVEAIPAAVFIVRHGEKLIMKDAKGRPMYKKDGKPVYAINLSEIGWRRAYAISFDENFNNNSQYGIPVACFGASPLKKGGSQRPIETITPLAHRLKLPVIKKFKENEHRAVVDEIMHNPEYDGKLVIMAWEHDNIPGLAKTFGAGQAPDHWNDDVFDRIWELIFDTETGKVVSFINAPQKLLYGDSSH